MPRALRNYPPGTCLHVIQRGDDRCVIFHDERERLHYLPPPWNQREHVGRSMSPTCSSASATSN